MRSVVVALVLLSGMTRALAQQPEVGDPADVPGQLMLVLGQGGHSAAIRDFAFTGDGKKLFTLSEDNTIQIWDAVSREHLRTLHLPWKMTDPSLAKKLTKDLRTDQRLMDQRLKPGALTGFVQAESLLALSPDGKAVAVVHPTGLRRLKKPLGGVNVHYNCEVLLVDVESGRMIRLPAAQGMFRHLAFSPDGDMLAAGGKTVQATKLKGEVMAGRMWLWHGLQKALQAEDATLAHPKEWKQEGFINRQEILAIDWAPDGSKMAASWSAGRLRTVTVHPSLQLINSLSQNVRKIAPGLFPQVVWRPDGGRLAAVEDSKKTVRVWTTTDGRELRTIKTDRAILGAPVFRGANDLLLVGADADDRSATVMCFDLGNLKKSTLDEILQFPLPAKLHRAALAPDGQRLATLGGAARDDLALLELQPDAKPQPVAAGLQPTPFFAFSKEGYKLAWTGNDRKQLIAGIDLQTAEALPATELQAEAFGTPASTGSSGAYMATQRFAHGGLIDMTKKVKQKPGAKVQVQRPLVLTIFAEGQDWVLCTQEGYYAATPGGERKVGWHVNQGFTRLASFYPLDRFRKKLYRPDVLSLVLAKGSVAQALKEANASRGGKEERDDDVEELLPPRCMLDVLEHGKGTVKLRIRAEARVKGQPLIGLRLYVDGRPFVPGGQRGLKKVDTSKTSADFPEGKDKVDLTWTFDLPGEKAAGAYQLTVMAGSRDASAPSNAVAVTFVNAVKLPALHVLAAGINKYQNPALTLNFAAKDAKDLAAAFAKQAKGGLFAQVTTQVVLDAQATRQAILAHIQKVRTQVKANDLFIVYFAGHGVKEKDQFYLLTVEAKVAALAGSTLSGADLREALGQFPCQVLLMLDACHSAGFGAKGVLRAQNLAPATNDATRALTEDEIAVAVMCAAMGHESALEKDGNGLFTRAVLDALARGKGVPFNPDNHLVYTHHLQAFVFDEVNRRSAGRQHPFLSLPWVVQSFPVAR